MPLYFFRSNTFPKCIAMLHKKAFVNRNKIAAITELTAACAKILPYPKTKPNAEAPKNEAINTNGNEEVSYFGSYSTTNNKKHKNNKLLSPPTYTRKPST